MDASALANSIAHLNTQSTFSPLQALQDTDVAGYLRHAHEQNLISTIEEGRKETQADFYRLLDETAQRDWEAKKRRVFEELGGMVTCEARTPSSSSSQLKKSLHGKSSLAVSSLTVCKLHELTHIVSDEHVDPQPLASDAKQNDGLRSRHH